MTREATDTDTAEQIIDSFRILAGDKVKRKINRKIKQQVTEMMKNLFFISSFVHLFSCNISVISNFCPQIFAFHFAFQLQVNHDNQK